MNKELEQETVDELRKRAGLEADGISVKELEFEPFIVKNERADGDGVAVYPHELGSGLTLVCVKTGSRVSLTFAALAKVTAEVHNRMIGDE